MSNKPKWTAHQQEAINFSKKDVLISAGAGSGKTATLTERIIHLVCDEGIDISRLLIVTFTNAAVDELKLRISKALHEAIVSRPNVGNLAKQISKLESAKIMTIDAFMRSEISPYYTKFKMPPMFEMLDEADAKVMSQEIMADVINGRFEKNDEDFKKLFECFSSPRKDSEIEESLCKLYNNLLGSNIKISTIIERLEEIVNAEDILKSSYFTVLRTHIKDFCQHYISIYNHYDKFLQFEDLYSKISVVINSDILFLNSIEDGLNISYDKLKYLLEKVDYSRLPQNKSKSIEYEQFEGFRKAFKNDVDNLSDYFKLSSDELKNHANMMVKLYSTLENIFEEYGKKYMEEKQDQGKMTFADVEHEAHRLFVNEDGTPTELAENVGNKYDYIFIDEYQDTSKTQDDIFAAIGEKSKRFIVGDVKQSIYGFRGANPEGFTSYRNKYQDADDKEVIFMSENFRCDKYVIDLSNIVSDYIFSSGKTPFEEDDKLIFKKDPDKNKGFCEILVTNYKNPYAVYADRIVELLNTGKRDPDKDGNVRPVEPKDIAILLRSSTGAASIEKELRARNIPVSNNAEKDLFGYGEVLMFLCFLNMVDNPLRDIYMTGALKSPMMGYTLDDLLRIRIKDKRSSVWHSLLHYAEKGEDSELRSRVKATCAKIERLRNASRRLDALEITNLIIAETNLMSYGGDETRTVDEISKSLRVIINEAASVAKRGGNLSDLISRIDALLEKNEKEKFVKSDNSVNILTIHKSKGLEFPIVFLCKADSVSKGGNNNTSYNIDKDADATIRLYDTDGLLKASSPLNSIVKLNKAKAELEDETRILYVALTRAVEQLIICGKVTADDNGENIKDTSIDGPENTRSPYALYKKQSFLKWILSAVNLAPDVHTCTIRKVLLEKDAEEPVPTAVYRKTNTDATEGIHDDSYFENSHDYKYSRDYLSKVPRKLTVSALKPDILNIEDSEESSLDPYSNIPDSNIPMPEFMQGGDNIKGTDVGTATHMFMQFCNPALLKENGAKEELDRLVINDFISEKDAQLVSIEEVEKYRNSELIDRVLKAKKVFRERCFIAKLPASQFTTNEELKSKFISDNVSITVQGVVDCLFYDENGKLVLIDYKTDRLTAAEKKDKNLAAAKLIPRHSRQLNLYRDIVREILKCDVDEVYIYSVPLGDTINIDGGK